MAEERQRIQMTISPKLLSRIDAYCEHIGVSRSAWVQTVLAERLDQIDARRSSIDALQSKQE